MRCTECCKSMAQVVQLIGERKKRLEGVTGCGGPLGRSTAGQDSSTNHSRLCCKTELTCAA